MLLQQLTASFVFGSLTRGREGGEILFIFERDPKIKKGGKNGQKMHFWAFYEIARYKRECREARRMRAHTTDVNEGESDG